MKQKFHFTQKTEQWEEEKEEQDWERFYWEKSKSKHEAVKFIKDMTPDVKEEEILVNEKVKNYAEAVAKLHDEGENADNLEKYKQSVIQLLF